MFIKLFTENNLINHIKQNSKSSEEIEWIIDSRCPINLTKKINNLQNIKDINNKLITYPNDKTEKIKMVGKYLENFNNVYLKVFYTENIKNNLISTHHLVLNGHTLIIDFDNIKNRDCLQIFKNNKLISTIYANNDHLFTLNTNNISESKLINQLNVTDFDYES